MGKTVLIRVDKDLQSVLEDVRKSVAKEIKSKYNLNEVTINGTFASSVLAARQRGQKFMNVKIRKVGLNKGVLELL